MRTSIFLCLIALSMSHLCFAQEVENSKSPPERGLGLAHAYMVQLTEFRIKKSTDAPVPTDEILKSFDELKDNGEIEIIETIRLSALPGYESMMQIGRRAAVTVGVMNAPGRGQTRQVQHQMIGTMVRLTAEPSNGKTLLKLTYEASRFEGEGTDDSPPDTKTLQFNTTLLLDPSKTSLVGGTSADSSTYCPPEALAQEYPAYGCYN
jgi:hypothetical protein